MLTTRMQIQALSDRLAGLPAPFKARHFAEPWKTCWKTIEAALPGQEHNSLAEALQSLPDPYDPDYVIQAILHARPGQPIGSATSLSQLSADLDPIDWVWPGWLPRGMITLLGAAPGSGKSFLALDLARRIIHGEPLPDGQPVPRPGAAVLYVDAEAVPQILNARAGAWGMDTTRLFLMLPGPTGILDFGESAGQDRLIGQVAGLHPELIIVDSLSSISSRGENSVEDIRMVLAFLNLLAQEFEAGLLLIHHLRKSPGLQVKSASLSLDDFRGSSHILAMARSVLGLSAVQTGPEPDYNGPRKLQVVKSNLGALPKPLGFEIVALQPAGAALKWGQAPRAYRPPTLIDQCKEWLEAELRQGPRRPTDLYELGEEAGYNRTLIYRAREELGDAVQNTLSRHNPKNAWRWAAGPEPEPVED